MRKILKINDFFFFFAQQEENVVRANKEILFFDRGQDPVLRLVWPKGLTNRINGSQIDDTDILSWGKSSCTIGGTKGFQACKASCYTEKEKTMYTRLKWTTSGHICLWATSAPLLPIYMTMIQCGSIVSSPWTFNSLMSQLSCRRAGRTAKPAELDQKFQSRFFRIFKRHQIFHAALRRLAGFGISPEFPLWSSHLKIKYGLCLL